MESFTIQVKRENVTENSFDDADISSSAYDVNNENENSHEIDIKEENVLLQRDGVSYYGDFPGHMQTPYPTEFTSNNNTPALRSQRNHTFPSATTAYRSSSQSRMPLSSDDHFFVSTKLNNAQTNESLYELKNLLISWNLEEFYDYFIEQQLFVDVLKHLSFDMAKTLLKNFSLGVQIEFNHHFNKWIKTVHNTAFPSPNVVEVTNGAHSYEPTTPTTGFVKHTASTFTLRQILESSVEGESIMAYYKTHKCLSDGVRQLLVDAVVNFYSRNKRELVTTDCANLSQQIVRWFNGEEAAYYYAHRSGACPRGKLYNKFHNLKAKIREATKSGNTPKSLNKNSTTKIKLLESDVREEEKYIRALNCENLNQNEVLVNWKGCTNTRINDIRTIENTEDFYKKWPQYKCPYGHVLIDIDFTFLYGERNKISYEIDNFFDMIMKVYQKQIKDAQSISILNELENRKDFIDPNGRFAALFYLMHALLTPTTKEVYKGDDGRKHVKRFTLRDSQNSFMVQHSTKAEWDAYIAQSKTAERHNPNYPLISLIGDSLLDTKEIFVYFQSNRFEFFNVVKAVDTCFKIFFLFNIKYPLPCQAVWQFIDSYFYNVVETAIDMHTNVKVLLNELKIQQN